MSAPYEVQLYMYVCMWLRIQCIVHSRVCVHAYVHVRACVCVCMRVCMRVCLCDAYTVHVRTCPCAH